MKCVSRVKEPVITCYNSTTKTNHRVIGFAVEVIQFILKNKNKYKNRSKRKSREQSIIVKLATRQPSFVGTQESIAASHPLPSKNRLHCSLIESVSKETILQILLLMKIFRPLFIKKNKKPNNKKQKQLVNIRILSVIIPGNPQEAENRLLICYIHIKIGTFPC